MTESQNMLVARVMMQLVKGFVGMNVQQQSEVMQTILEKVKIRIEGPQNLQNFNKVYPSELAEGDRNEARKKAVEKQAADKRAAEWAKAEADKIALAEAERLANIAEEKTESVMPE